MPYYNVRTTTSMTKEFVICAPDRTAAGNILSAAIAANKCDHKKIVATRTDVDENLSVYDADKTNWTDALKKAKAK
jgi:hypothetical protein